VVLFPYGIEYLLEVLPVPEDWSDSVFAVNYAAFGLVMILFLLFEPQGLVGIWLRIKNYLLLWPFRQRPLGGG
jgi:branched-chain amino acid transport system permease protein